jgi:alcohol dehydrogenase class IV
MELKYLMPTRVLMGADCVRANSSELARLGKKALIVTGPSSSRANGSLDDVIAALSANGQGHETFDAVPANPGVECVYEGASLARKSGCDFVVAIGGGSPMDAAKVIALLAKAEIPRSALFSGNYGSEILPLVHVPTTAGTGSEVTQYAIITNVEAETKSGIATPLFFPKLALLDPKYMASLSRRTMVNTVVDSLSHSIEGIISNRASALTDTLAAKGIELVGECLPALADGTLTAEQREKLLLASTLGGIVIANTGTTALHAMGYSLTYFREIEHGRANGLLLVSFLKFVQRSKPDLVRKILSPLKMSSLTGLMFVLDKLLGEKEAMTREELEKFADKAFASKNVGNCAVKPTRDEILGIFIEVFANGAGGPNIASKRHSVIEFIKLEDYIPASHLRTIPPRLRSVPCGKTEIPVEIELSSQLSARVKIPVTWDGKIYSYVHDNEYLQRVFSGEMAKDLPNRRILLNDWGEAFLLTFENGTRDREVSYFATTNEVTSLFENCSVFLEPEDIYKM